MKPTSAVALPPDFRSTFLDELTPREIETALRAAKQEKISPRQILQQEGVRAVRLWLLVTGRVAVYRLAPDGDRVFLRWGVPGDTFGLSTILKRPETFIVTIEAVQGGSLLVWDLPSSRTLVLRCPNLNKALNAVLASYLDRLINELGTYAFQAAEQRLARVIVESARQLGCTECEPIELDITNEQLAVAARMTVFTATRKLSKWQARGILTKRRGKIVMPSLSCFDRATKDPSN
jgi:CRP/FNR family transcriptional regulator, nitrogen oxide reductase regulator